MIARRLLIALVTVVSVTTACSDDESADGGNGSSQVSFCDTVSAVNDALDFIGAAFLTGDQQGSAEELQSVLADGIATMNDAVDAAPSDEAGAAAVIRDAYAGLQEALSDVDHVVGRLDVDDERLAALTDPALSDAIVSVNEACA